MELGRHADAAIGDDIAQTATAIVLRTGRHPRSFSHINRAAWLRELPGRQVFGDLVISCSILTSSLPSSVRRRLSMLRFMKLAQGRAGDDP